MTNIPKIGIAWFNKGTYHKCDTCIDGKVEFGVEVRSLNRQVIWITNLRVKGDPHATTLFKQYGYLRHTQFFRIPFTQVIFELDCNYDKTHEEKMILLDAVYTKLSRKLFDSYGVDFSQSRDSVMHLINKKYRDNSQALTLNNSSIISDLNYAIKDSLQKFQSSDVRLCKSIQKIHSVVIPRSAHFLAMTQCNYPVGSDYVLDDNLNGKVSGKADSDFGEDSDEVRDYLDRIQTTSAGFVEFQILGTDSLYSNVFMLGQEIGHFRVRNWASIPEILFMMNYTKVRIKRMFLTRSGRRDIHPVVDDFSNIRSISWVTGLCNELMFSGFGYDDSKNPTSPCSAYYRAYDRIFTGLIATKFIQSGLRVSGFALGKIYIIADKGNQEEQRLIRDIAIENNCIPEFSLI